MDSANLLGSEEKELQFLLNYSCISENKQEKPWLQLSMSPDKLNLTEKERTREESYQEIMKQIHHAKLEGKQLASQLQALKNQIFARYLNSLQQEMDELDLQNVRLRKQLHSSTIKKQEERSERHSTRSPIKLRTSIKSSYVNENKKTSTKGQNRVTPNLLFKKEIKMTQSTSNLGRSQAQSPQNHKKRESQLTQRKVEDHKMMRTQMSFSVLDDQDCVEDFKIKESVSVRNLVSQENSKQNVFVRILKDILEEERKYQTEKFWELYDIRPQIENSEEGQVNFIDQIEAQIQKTNQKIEMLDLILSNFQQEISQLNANLKLTDDLTQKLWQVKGKYIQMQRNCGSLMYSRKDVSQKEERLMILCQGKKQQKPISSVETLIKLLSHQGKTFRQSSTKIYMDYCSQIKSLFKFEKTEQGRQTNRTTRVKQTIDSIREGRKKFNELIHIYEARISKLQEKIERMSCHNQS